MVDLDDELSWTTVVHRRAFKQRSSPRFRSRSSRFPVFRAHSARVPSSQLLRERGAPGTVPAEAWNEGKHADDAEPLVLLSMKRSMVKLQESRFFRRFLDQTASSPVFDNLRRAATPLPELELRTQACTADARAVRTEDNPGKIEGKSALEFASPPFESEERMASSTPSTNMFANRSTYKKSEVAFKLESSSITSDRDGELEEAASVEVKDETLNCTNHLLEPSRKEKPSADISIKDWQLQVVVYGLGKIADSEVSRCQLAFVLLLKQKFPWIGGIEIYDPILSQSECRVIQGLGCSIISINEEGRRSIEKPTVFYMPHCEDWLYDNVLQANWTPLKLRQLVILGNSFRSYQEIWSSFPRTRSKAPPTYVLELQQTAHEIPLEATSSLELPAFNNLSWHFFPGF